VGKESLDAVLLRALDMHPTAHLLLAGDAMLSLCYVNQAATRLFGATAEQLQGDFFLLRLGASFSPEVLLDMQDALSQTGMWQKRLEITTQAEHSLWVDTLWQQVPSESESPLMVQLIPVEQCISETARRFETLVQHSDDMIAILDHGGILRYQNPIFFLRMGFQPQDIIGKHVFGLIHPDDLPRVEQAFATILANPDLPLRVGMRVKDVHGTWHHFDCTGTNRLHHPEIAGIMVNGRDVSEQKRWEQEREQIILLVDAVIDHSPIPIHIFDAEGYSLRMNEAQRRHLGDVSSDYEVGVFNVLADPEMLASGQSERFRRVYAGEAMLKRQALTDVGPSGQRPCVHNDLFPVLGPDQQVAAIVSFGLPLCTCYNP
jgi:PAS domain S-box-containing protein